MKIKTILSILCAFMVAGLTSCGYDNYDEPEATFSGNIQYKGENLQLAGTGGQIQLQLYQPGYPLNAPITVYVDQDGHYSAKLFDGYYKLVTKDNNGPWVNTRDTVDVHVKGNTVFNLEVTPYYTLANPSVSVSGNKLTFKVDVKRIVSDAHVADGIVVIGTTALIDNSHNLAAVSIPAASLKEGTNTVTAEFSADNIAALKKAVKPTVRFGLKAEAATQYIFTPVIDLTGKLK